MESINTLTILINTQGENQMADELDESPEEEETWSDEESEEEDW